MIVVDTSVFAYFWILGNSTVVAQSLASVDPAWKAPRLWRSEFRNVLAPLVRTRKMDERTAVAAVRGAEKQMAEGECEVDSAEVLRLAAASGATAYDGEFVALARQLGVPLVTGERRLAKAFPDEALLLESALEGLP